jgi:ubiquinone/menaquinone biosynthesis C-methylase UbiE
VNGDEALYNTIGEGYDRTRHADPLIVSRLQQLLRLSNDGLYLDVACGTGNYSIALAAFGGCWVGIDSSDRMVKAARRKSAKVEWHVADATALPFPPGRISGAICVLAVHHFCDRLAAFKEMRRVVAPGANVVLFTADKNQMRRYWLNIYFPQAMARSIAQMASADQLERELLAANFRIAHREPYFVQDDLEDFFLYCGKHSPERYLSPAIRAGMSTFANLADVTEVERGCQQLESDMNTGRVHEIIKASECPDGDYLFLVGEAT